MKYILWMSIKTISSYAWSFRPWYYFPRYSHYTHTDMYLTLEPQQSVCMFDQALRSGTLDPTNLDGVMIKMF